MGNEKEKNENIEEQDKEVKDNKVKTFFGKFGNKIATGAKAFSRTVSSTAKNVKTNIDEHNRAKELEKRLCEVFESTAIKLNMVNPNKNNKVKKVFARIDYDNKILTLLAGEKDIDRNCFFIDELNQRFNISFIRMNQYIELQVDSVEYKKDVIVIDYNIENDENTKNQMKTIINNNNITINDSTIKKSNIG